MVTYKKRLKVSDLFQWNLQGVSIVSVIYMAVLWKILLSVVCFVALSFLIKIFYLFLLNNLEWLLEIIHFLLHAVLVYNFLQHMNREHIVNVLQLLTLLNMFVMVTIVI